MTVLSWEVVSWHVFKFIQHTSLPGCWKCSSRGMESLSTDVELFFKQFGQTTIYFLPQFFF
jgi:hypothetical protein